MGKRIICLFTIEMLLLTGLYFRVIVLSKEEDLIATGEQQTTYTLNAYKMRANIYDRNFLKLVNETEKYSAAVLPGDTDGAFFEYFPIDEAEELSKSIAAGKPFITECSAESEGASGVTVFKYYDRYSSVSLCSHIIGYTDEAGVGVYGLEKAYDEYLRETGESVKISYSVNARGNFLEGTEAEITSEGGNGGIVLTIDKKIQEIVETAGKNIKKGAVVVMDPYNGDILASASFPNLDVHDLASAVNNEDSPFINRAFSAYSIGSTFKIVMCAAAIENGISPSEAIECTGTVEMEDTVFRCHNINGHGVLTMTEAVEQSCNPYFIELGRRIGFEGIRATAMLLGLGKETVFADGLTSVSGYLPEEKDIKTVGDLANFSFGQGSLSVTPIQLAGIVSAVVNSGKCPTPRLVKGYADSEGTGMSEITSFPEYIDAFSAETAAKLKEFMISAVENGTGSPARPTNKSAGGKTGSAETGQYDSAGKQILNTLFCGFYPADRPQYSIVVLCENGVSGSITCGPIFKEICDRLEEL